MLNDTEINNETPFFTIEHLEGKTPDEVADFILRWQADADLTNPITEAFDLLNAVKEYLKTLREE